MDSCLFTNHKTFNEMNQEAKSKLRNWLSQFPETVHPLDSRRMYDLVIALHDTGSQIDKDDIKEMLEECKPGWKESEIEEFAGNKATLISELKEFLAYLRARG